jgi:hypothetical protein
MASQTFRVITTFVNDLGEVFSNENHPLALYERLINKTTPAHVEAIEKHILSFKMFLTENEENIISRKMPFAGVISYSPKVFIDMNVIMGLKMDEETTDVIWRHLLTLSAIVANSSKSRDILKEKAGTLVKSDEDKGEEDDFLNKIISKVESQVNPNVSDPQEAIGSLMSSNLIPELVSSLNTGISSGKLDLSKMISSVQKMVGNISGEAQADPNLSNAMGMLNNMMSMMGNRQ